MALTKKTAIDGLKKEDTGGAGADALTTGIAFLCDGIKDEPVWGAGTNWQIHYAYGLDLGSPTSVSKIIVYDNRDTDNFYGGRDDTDVWASDDNVTYSFLKTFSAPTRTGSGSGYAVWELELDEPVSYRYFKVFCSSAADGLWVDGGYWCQISELEAWGEKPFYFSGYVYEGPSTTISGAIIYMYREDTGAYMGSTTSNDDGEFYIETTYSGSHFLVCLDPEGGTVYNDLIYGQMYPATISG